MHSTRKYEKKMESKRCYKKKWKVKGEQVDLDDSPTFSGNLMEISRKKN